MLTDDTERLNNNDAAQTAPTVLMPQPGYITDGPASTHFNATVSAVGLLDKVVVNPLVLFGLRLVEKRAYVLLERRMVALEGQHVVAALIDDLAGDLALGTQRINRDNAPTDLQGRQQLRDRCDLIRLV